MHQSLTHLKQEQSMKNHWICKTCARRLPRLRPKLLAAWKRMFYVKYTSL